VLVSRERLEGSHLVRPYSEDGAKLVPPKGVPDLNSFPVSVV